MTDYLYARPSILEGIGRILDIAGTMPSYNIARSSEQADIDAIRSDFETVGNDIAHAIGQFEESEPDVQIKSK